MDDAEADRVSLSFGRHSPDEYVDAALSIRDERIAGAQRVRAFSICCSLQLQLFTAELLLWRLLILGDARATGGSSCIFN